MLPTYISEGVTCATCSALPHLALLRHTIYSAFPSTPHPIYLSILSLRKAPQIWLDQVWTPAWSHRSSVSLASSAIGYMTLSSKGITTVRKAFFLALYVSLLHMENIAAMKTGSIFLVAFWRASNYSTKQWCSSTTTQSARAFSTSQLNYDGSIVAA